MTILTGGPAPVLPDLGPSEPREKGLADGLAGREQMTLREMCEQGWLRDERVAYYAGYGSGGIQRATAESRAKRKAHNPDRTIWNLT